MIPTSPTQFYIRVVFRMLCITVFPAWGNIRVGVTPLNRSVCKEGRRGEKVRELIYLKQRRQVTWVVLNDSVFTPSRSDPSLVGRFSLLSRFSPEETWWRHKVLFPRLLSVLPSKQEGIGEEDLILNDRRGSGSQSFDSDLWLNIVPLLTRKYIIYVCTTCVCPCVWGWVPWRSTLRPLWDRPFYREVLGVP